MQRSFFIQIQVPIFEKNHQVKAQIWFNLAMFQITGKLSLNCYILNKKKYSPSWNISARSRDEQQTPFARECEYLYDKRVPQGVPSGDNGGAYATNDQLLLISVILSRLIIL